MNYMYFIFSCFLSFFPSLSVAGVSRTSVMSFWVLNPSAWAAFSMNNERKGKKMGIRCCSSFCRERKRRKRKLVFNVARRTVGRGGSTSGGEGFIVPGGALGRFGRG